MKYNKVIISDTPKHAFRSFLMGHVHSEGDVVVEHRLMIQTPYTNYIFIKANQRGHEIIQSMLVHEATVEKYTFMEKYFKDTLEHRIMITRGNL